MQRINTSVNQCANVLASRKLSKQKRKQKTPEPSPCRFRAAIKVQGGTRPDIRMPQAPPAIHVAYRHCRLRVIHAMWRSTAQAFLLCLTAVKVSGRCVTEARAAGYLHASLGALTKHRSAGMRTKYDESAAGIRKATARIAHVGARRMLQRLARFKLPES